MCVLNDHLINDRSIRHGIISGTFFHHYYHSVLKLGIGAVICIDKIGGLGVFIDSVRFLANGEAACLMVLEAIEANACTPSVGQAYHLKEESQAGRLTRAMTVEMMAREKPNQREAVRVPWERLRGAVPEDYDAKHREEFIVKACEYYAKYLRRQRDRDAR